MCTPEVPCSSLWKTSSACLGDLIYVAHLGPSSQYFILLKEGPIAGQRHSKSAYRAQATSRVQFVVHMAQHWTCTA